MNEFEREIGKTFQAYRDARIANMVFLHPPMRAAGQMGKVPCFIQSGKAPFDIGGFFYDKAATVIGVELKQTADHEHSLPIVHPEKKGNGLQYHQLSALVDVHEANGLAVVLWNNGGEIGYLPGNVIQLAKIQYDASLKAERAGKELTKGSRSILWGHFKLVKPGHEGAPLWLPPSPVARKKAA